MESEVKELIKENNILLKRIIKHIEYNETSKGNEDIKDFVTNIIANLIANNYGKISRI